MYEQVTTFEKCRWHECMTMTNHVFQTFDRRGDKVEFPCCVRHQSDAAAAFDHQNMEMDEEAKITIPQDLLVREVYDQHRTEKETTYEFKPSWEAKRRMARAERKFLAVQNTAPELARELLAQLRARMATMATPIAVV